MLTRKLGAQEKFDQAKHDLDIARKQVEAARAQSLGQMGLSYAFPPGYNPVTPVTIRSQYAEVVYWMGPRMARTPAGGLVYQAADDGDDTDGLTELNYPQYVDNDGDEFPDQFVLYRRVLLIRPDLNVTSAGLTAAGRAQTGFGSLLVDQPVVGFMRADGTVEPCGNSVTALNPGVWDPGGGSPLGVTPNWLVGMALVQQSMDLSVARELQYSATGILSTVAATLVNWTVRIRLWVAGFASWDMEHRLMRRGCRPATSSTRSTASRSRHPKIFSK